jgi:hypothetical protein
LILKAYGRFIPPEIPVQNLKFTWALTFFPFCYRKDIHLIKTLCALFGSETRELPFANRRTGPQFNLRMFAKRQSKPAGGNALEEKKC